MRYRFSTDVQVSKKPTLTHGPSYSQPSNHNHLYSGSDGAVDLIDGHELTTDAELLVRDLGHSIATCSEILEPATAIVHDDETLDNDVHAMNQSLQYRADIRVTIAGDLALSSRQPWKQYLLNYCKLGT